jgi:hypothetical protein
MLIAEPAIYQLKVVLLGISPMIWRRLLVCGDSTIADLHYIIQIAMGWSDDHLHQFRIHGKRYGIARIGGIVFSDDPDSVRLKDLGLRINERFVYEYDFTDGWKHQIRVEAIMAPVPDRCYPVCIDGRRTCPPEDCGGPWAFMELRQHYSFFHIMERLLEIIEDGDNQNHREEIEALHYRFHVDRFDRKRANRRLYDYTRGENVFAWVEPAGGGR